jgi:hypothetical protein
VNIDDYKKVVNGKACRWCEYELPNEVLHYNHGCGWKVEGYQQRQWLFVRCPRCEHDWSLEKLGISRKIGDFVVAVEARS